MEIYLIRHTQVGVSRDICYGITDVQLADSQQDDIDQVKQKCKDIVFDKVYASPLSRCMKLANSLFGDVICEDALLEMDFGDWEMQPWQELDRKVLDQWMENYLDHAPPNGEKYADFSMKSTGFFEQIISRESENARLALITHAGPIRAIICKVLNMPLEHAFHFDIDYGSVSCIDIVQGWRKVKYLNY